MNFISCPVGHLYDQNQYTSCPYCNNPTDSISFTSDFSAAAQIDYGTDLGATMAMDSFTPTPGMPSADVLNMTTPIDVTVPLIDTEVDINSTISVDRDDSGITEPEKKLVRGWLICCEGEYRGKTFSIYNQNNYAGRDAKLDIVIDFDKGISREASFLIVYDANNNRFFIAPTLSGAKATVYLNSKPLLSEHELMDFDKISLSNTVLVFRSLCSEGFKW